MKPMRRPRNRWLPKRYHLMIERYGGRWVAVVGQEVAGVGKEATEAFARAKRKFPGRRPVLVWVEPDLAMIYGHLL